jgi:hypothetical protein
MLCCILNKQESCSVSFIEYLQKKNAYFACHQNFYQNTVVPMHGTIAATSCVSCHILSNISHKKVGALSGWLALIHTWISDSEILAQQKGSGVWHICLYNSLKSPLQQSCSSLLLLLSDHIFEAWQHHHFRQGHNWSHVSQKKISCVVWFMPLHKSLILRSYPSRISDMCDHPSL